VHLHGAAGGELAKQQPGISNYISLLELGRNNASIKTLFNLTALLGVSVSKFMG
jgi:transcriptional regulator with XRE-family HTH domain